VLGQGRQLHPPAVHKHDQLLEVVNKSRRARRAGARRGEHHVAEECLGSPNSARQKSGARRRGSTRRRCPRPPPVSDRAHAGSARDAPTRWRGARPGSVNMR
jgi:hypothetical protein